MAASGQPDPSQAGGAPPPDGGAPGGAPSQGPANPLQIKLAQLYQICVGLAQQEPTLSGGMQKAAQGIQEAQTALVSQPSPQPTSSNPPY